jgi:adenosyl cobinamide kinase/adenosyl cobinamide phosphate guanylyltransferase
VSELTLVLGGTRSGKSRFALARASALGGDRVTFVATARPGDPELDARIAAHRRVRPPTWRTIEPEADLARAVARANAGDVVLLDSLTLWVASCLEGGIDVNAAWRAVSDELAARATPSVIVSDEVGLGIVPVTELGRRFRDEIGVLHQRVAANAAVVVLLVAGLPVTLKGTP